MKEDTEVSPRGLLLNNQTPTLPDRACLSSSLVEAAVLNGSRVAAQGNDYAPHSKDASLHIGRVGPGEEAEDGGRIPET